MIDRSRPPLVKAFEALTIPRCIVDEPYPGLRIHHIDTGDLPANRVSVVWNFGAATPGYHTSAAMMPLLLSEGTHHLTGAQLSELIEFNGAWFKCGQSNHFGSASMTSLNETTVDMLSLLGDMLCDATFPAESFDAIRAREVAARRLMLAKVDGLASALMTRMMSGDNHPYLNIVTPDELEKVSVEDIRRAHVHAIGHARIDIFAVGRLSDTVMSAIDRLAIKVKPREVTSAPVVVKAEPVSPGRIDRNVPGRSQSALRCAMPAIGRDHPDYEDLRHVVIALGGYFGSRLMTSIREQQGLTYGIQAALNGMPEGSYTCIDAQCDALNVQAALGGISNELVRLATRPMDNDELWRLRSEVATRLASTLDSPLNIMSYYQTCLTAGMPEGYFDRQFRSIMNLTPERIMDIAGRYLSPEEMRIVTVG